MGKVRAPSINQITIGGRLTRDPELSYIASGQALCKLGFANNRKFKNSAGDFKEDVMFMTAVVWGEQGERYAQNMRKGTPVLITGRLTSREWETKQGEKRVTTEILADKIEVLESIDEQSRPKEEPIQNDEIPF